MDKFETFDFTSIEIEFTLIEEAVEAILDCIKNNFLTDLPEDFISPKIEIDISKLIDKLKDDIFCVIEYPYVDKVYRDSYYNYYSSKHYSYKRDCIRVSLFEKEVKPEYFLNPEHHKVLDDIYLGYFVIRPTTSAPFGRSMIDPRAFLDADFKICKCKSESSVYGIKLHSKGFPHSSQDGETMKCAEITIWALMEYFGSRYIEYRPTLPIKIHNALERFSFQRQLPSNGLTMDQISFALKEFDFGTREYSAKPFKVLFRIIDSYIESGIPVIVGLEHDDIGHAILIIGKQYPKRFNWKNVPKSHFLKNRNKVTYFDASDIPSKYVAHDDNMPPYQIISLDRPGEHYEDSDFQQLKIDTVVVPLYKRIYLESVLAKELLLQVMKDETVGYDFGKDFVFRYMLASSRSFKDHISHLKEMPDSLKNAIILTKMPKFIWCGEFYQKNDFNSKDKYAMGLIILDATEADNESIDAFIFAGYPDRCIFMSENNCVTLHQKLDKYRYFNNLQ